MILAVLAGDARRAPSKAKELFLHTGICNTPHSSSKILPNFTNSLHLSVDYKKISWYHISATYVILIHFDKNGRIA